MRRLAVLAMAITTPQPLLAEPFGNDTRGRVAASLPCVPNVIPMSGRAAPPRPRPERLTPPPPRRELPRRLPCLRLVTT